MLKLHFCPGGVCIPDAYTMDYALNLVDTINSPEENTLDFANAMLLDAIRVLVKRGTVNHKNLTILFENNLMMVCSRGNLDQWPRGFCDYTENFLMELL